MLGEEHSLIHEFPELKDIVVQLVESDKKFFADNRNYNALDKEIRELELSNAPIQDDAMHKLKHDRSILKDSLYKCLLKERNKQHE